MWEIIGTIVFVILALLIVGYKIWEMTAIARSQGLPLQTGKEALVGRSAIIIELSIEADGKRQIRVELDGITWNAVSESSRRNDLKVGDSVKVMDVVGIQLFVQ